MQLIPHQTHGNRNVQNQQPVEKNLSTVTSYSPEQKGHFKGEVTLSDLKWDPERVTATFKLQPKTLKSIVGAQIKVTMKDINNYQVDPSKDGQTTGSGTGSQSTQPGAASQSTPAKPQSITFRLQSSAAIVTPTNVDYMNPGLIGFSYAIYDPLDLIQKTGKDYNPFGEFPHLTPYNEQDWLKVIINKSPSHSISNKNIGFPDRQIFDSPRWDTGQPVETIEVPEEPIAIRTKTDAGFGVKYVTLYWRINSHLGTFDLPAKFRKGKPLWYPPGKVVNLPISLQFKNPDITSPASTYSFVLNSPYATPGHIMPYAKTSTPHDAKSIVNEGSNYWNRWNQRWGQRWDSDNLIPRINKFPKNISKVFWSAPSLEWTTDDRVLNDVFYLNRALPRLTAERDNKTGYNKETKNLQIQIGHPNNGIKYNSNNWDILYVKNKDHNKDKPDLSKETLSWNWDQQRFEAAGFQNLLHKSSWIISITNHDTGHPLLYDPINYYNMLGPFWPPELPEN